MSVFNQTYWLGEKGQAMLEYVLVLSAVALPLILVAKHMRSEMVAFLRHVVNTVSLWPIGA
ncbi:MAG: hypothetical protein GX998_05445 [Firmicutes bacterium]|nr:hypothetical protein [Bacillota bacterium]